MDNNKHSELRQTLLDWFGANKRDLPWRKDHSPYAIWISEIMLQQTQVKTVIPYFQRWMKRFPDVRSVAYGSEEELLKHWEGLGYYSRVRNIYRAAQVIERDFGGEFPREYRTVLGLPGIGRYTAGAIMSFAFNGNYPAVDGNVERVVARLFDLDSPIKEKKTQNFIWKTAGDLIPSGGARRFNQAIMELGAVICLPKRPQCPECPVRSLCKSYKSGTVERRPVSLPRKAPTPVEASVGVIVRNDRIFIQKRPGSGLMPHLWEFPGGKLKDGETPEEALVREIDEELGVSVRCVDKIGVIRHSYTSFRVALHAFLCELRDPKQEPELRSSVDCRWVTRRELDGYAFPAANRKLISML